jgi:hypothetical protein
MARRPADPEEELRWMSHEVRGYVEAVLNSLAANVPKVYIKKKLALLISLDPVIVAMFLLFFPLLLSGYCVVPSGEGKGRYAKPAI